jgi:SAM-dependent methyltransferase
MAEKKTAPVPETADWRGYYEWEAGQKRFLPGEEPGEALRVDFVFRLLRGITFERPLDAGCGNGYLASRLAERAGHGWGSDLSWARLKDAGRMFPRVTFARSSIFEQPFKDRSFDLVTAIEVVEHLDTPPRAVVELKRLSSRWVLITVPWRNKLQVLYCPHCNKSYYHDGHVQSFDEERLAGLVSGAGLKIVRLETYVPYYPPQRPPMSLLPRPVHQAVRGVFELAGLKEKVPPKYLGILAEKVEGR